MSTVVDVEEAPRPRDRSPVAPAPHRGPSRRRTPASAAAVDRGRSPCRRSRWSGRSPTARSSTSITSWSAAQAHTTEAEVRRRRGHRTRPADGRTSTPQAAARRVEALPWVASARCVARSPAPSASTSSSASPRSPSRCRRAGSVSSTARATRSPTRPRCLPACSLMTGPTAARGDRRGRSTRRSSRRSTRRRCSPPR